MTLSTDRAYEVAAELVQAAVAGDDVGEMAAALTLEEAGDWRALAAALTTCCSVLVGAISQNVGIPNEDIVAAFVAEIPDDDER